ncbi:MAG: hypothetical protein RL065_1376, partial [Bacteroidota bacterium]
MRKLFLSFLISVCSSAFAFGIPPIHIMPEIIHLKFDSKNPNSEYRSPENPYYWKNRKPFETYWQQDVQYTINAIIDEVNDIIIGDEQLQYFNNSPDTLKEIYFHLYQNAFQPNSYLDDLNKANHVKTKWGKYESKGMGTEIKTIRINGEEVTFEQDFSIVKIKLNRVLPPNMGMAFQINFKTYWDNGSQRRRMKKFDAAGHKDENGFKHYDGVHWYPRICVYDAKFGWDVQQHMGKEFYGDYGSFDVTLNFPSNYVVEATGWLQNENEVMPNELRKKLDIKNFFTPYPSKIKVKGKGIKGDKVVISTKPTEIIPYEKSNRKTWNYHATNVHDFAFTADPTYRIGETEWNGIKIVSLVQESHAAGWKNAADYTAKVIEYYSNRVGMYAYPKMVVADAQDGMEYPMLTLDGGSDPGYRDLLAHEVGHNWFFGMVGNNETYRAMLDEGFTQFLNTNACEAIDGKYRIQPKSKSWYVNRFKQKDVMRSSETYNGYMMDAIRESSATLNTHSDDFSGALNHDGGYRNVYFKTSTMLFNLQYVLGDSLFWKSFSNYFNQWKMCHPYPEDFRNSMHQSTKADLNWFFDEWMETSKTIDYEVKNVRLVDANKYKITLQRNGEMQMPIDLRVIDKNNKTYDFHIPNTWFVKNTSASVLPKWWGWGKFRKQYIFEAQLNAKLKDVIIDTSLRLADNDMRNNAWKNNSKWLFDSQLNQPTDWTREVCKWRPELWWNGVDGMKLGLHVNGNYMNYKHSFSATVWYNTRLFNNIAETDYVKNNKDGLKIYNKINFNIEAQ